MNTELSQSRSDRLSSAKRTESVTWMRKRWPTASDTLPCHWWLLPSTTGVAYPLATRLWKLHIGWATSSSSAVTPVCAQRCSSSGVQASTLRPHHWRPCSPLQAACTTIRVDYKVAVMAFGALNGLSPPNLDQLVRVSNLPGHHRLRSSSSHRLQVPAYRLATVGHRSFPVAASIHWNSLPPDIQSPASLTDFCHNMFHQSFPDSLL